MAIPHQPPFRMPCEAVAGSPTYFMGGPFQHAAPDVRDKYVNITTVPDPLGGDPIPPYERFTPDLSGGESCETHSCNPDAAPCAPWLLPLIANVFSHTPGDKVDFAVTRKRGFKNVMARRYWSGAWGYRNAEASGGPDTSQACADCSFDRWRGYTSAIDGTKYLNITIAAEDKEQQYNYDGSCTLINTQVNWDDTASISQSINPTSGLRSITALTVTPNTDLNRALTQLSIGLWTWSEIVAHFANPEHSVFTPGGHVDCTDTSITVYNDTDGPAGTAVDELLTWDLAAGTFNRKFYDYDGAGTQRLIEEESITVSDASLAYSIHTITFGPCGAAAEQWITVTGTLGGANTSASIYGDVKNNLLSLWPLNDDALYPWRFDQKVSASVLVSRDELLTNGFTGASWAKDYGAPIMDGSGNVLGDPGWSDHTGVVASPDPATGTAVVVMGGPASNGDDFTGLGVSNQFPFTTTTGYSMAGVLPPGVSFSTSTGLLSGTCSADCTWGITVTCTAALPQVTGAIKGTPNPAGYQPAWDFSFQEILGCCYRPESSPGTQTWSWYQHGWGMDVGKFNSDTGCSLPLNATQWTNYFQSVNKPQGAFLFYNDTENDYFGAGCVSSSGGSGAGDAQALWGCKYAECLELWPSQNFALPAGDMKFWFDENKVFCATDAGSIDGSTWNLVDPVTGIAPPDGTDFSGYWGGRVVNGFYEVASYSAGVLTLGAQIYNVPSNWASKSNSDEAFCFGKLRYPNAPALLGRVGITPDVAGTTFTFASAQPAFAQSATSGTEQIDLYDASMTLLAGNVTATRIDDTHFSVVSAAVPARFVQIHGAAKWYMNDTAPKGDFAALQWWSDFRTFGESQRLSGVLDCSGTQVAQPTVNVGGGPVELATRFAAFTQMEGCLPFFPCSPKVVCFSPNGETWSNGITYPFPETFTMDELYGSKWWGFVLSVMTDLFWQKPHRPCNIESCAKWQMDGGDCADNSPGSCPGDDDFVEGESVPPIFYFAHAPQVEARLTVPANYGLGQDESAPALPDDVQIGWLSPVLYDTGDVALPPLPPGALIDRGEPAGAATAWDLHALFCAHSAGCRFNYALPGC